MKELSELVKLAPTRPSHERDSGAAEPLVTMSNALIRAGHGLTLAEKRLIALAVSKLKSNEARRPYEPVKTRIMAHEFSAEFGLDPDVGYEQLKDATKSVFNRVITFFEQAKKRNGKPLEPTKIQTRWVTTAKYQKGEGWVELTWNEGILVHLVGLTQRFTTYQLQQASAFRSVYSWRLMELLMRFKDTGWATYDIEDFRASMETPPSLSDFGQLRRRVIDPAIKELSEKDGWLINLTLVKAGRRIKALRFDFTRNPQKTLFDVAETQTPEIKPKRPTEERLAALRARSDWTERIQEKHQKAFKLALQTTTDVDEKARRKGWAMRWALTAQGVMLLTAMMLDEQSDKNP